jgi:hypothetical protein
MRQFMMTVTALAVFGVMVDAAQAESQTASSRTVSGRVKNWTVSHTARPSQAKRAASKATANSYDVCEKKARDIGLVQGEAGHNCYVRNCMGFVPFSGCH